MHVLLTWVLPNLVIAVMLAVLIGGAVGVVLLGRNLFRRLPPPRQ